MDVKSFRVSKNLVSYLEQTSAAAESYRALRTNLQYSSIDKKVKSIVITSPGPIEGKTVTSCNLAVTMANVGCKVLLIDADLRKPAVHKEFKLSNKVGLVNLLMNESDLIQSLKIFPDIENLTILPCGTVPPNPAEIIASTKLKEVLEYFKTKYDYVIIDSPPAGYVSETAILAKLADGVILTISAGETNIALAKQVVKTLKNVEVNILGVVMTKMNFDKKQYYQYY